MLSIWFFLHWGIAKYGGRIINLSMLIYFQIRRKTVEVYPDGEIYGKMWTCSILGCRVSKLLGIRALGGAFSLILMIYGLVLGESHERII